MQGLLRLLRPRNGSFGTSEASRLIAVSAITLKAQTLAEQLLTRRHFVSSANEYDPRFLTFEFTHNIVLRESQVRTA